MKWIIYHWQDADSQRKTAKNYRFAWDPLMVEDMEAEVKSLAEEAEDTPASLYDITEDKSGGEAAGGGEKKKADLFSIESLFGVPDSRQRPSSAFDPLGKKSCLKK